MERSPGLSVRLKLTVSYAGFVMLAGALLLIAGYFSLSRGFHPGVIFIVRSDADLLQYFAPIAVIVMGFLLIFGMVGGWVLAGRMLAPLARITEATRIAANGSLAHRIGLSGRKDEFRELADAFDTMLTRLEAHVAEQRRFAANASHELRTPLAITQTLLEVARKDPARDTNDLIEHLSVVNDRAIELTEALLLLSRAEQRSLHEEVIDLSLVAEEVAETLLPLAEKRFITLETAGDRAPVLGSPALLAQLTTNLIHNAIIHNLPEHGSVVVTTTLHDARVALDVENSGEMIAPELVDLLVEPFLRLDERTHLDHAGVGLGLAIAKRIVDAHGGTLTLTPQLAGGLRATVELPAVTRDPETGVRHEPRTPFTTARSC